MAKIQQATRTRSLCEHITTTSSTHDLHQVTITVGRSPDAPDVSLLAVVALVRQHLGSHVVGGAAGSVQHLGPGGSVPVGVTHIQRRQAEVADLQVAVIVQQQILTAKHNTQHNHENTLQMNQIVCGQRVKC